MNITSGNETYVNETILQDPRVCTEDQKLRLPAIDIVFLCICFFGLVGNITVFWNLCFRIPWNKYTIYITNLAVVDSLLITVMMLTLMVQISNFFGLYPGVQVTCPFYKFVDACYYSLVYSGKNILTAISVERCISVLFPIWHRTRRPLQFSTMACIVLWFFGILEGLLDVFVCVPEAYIEQQPQCVAVEVMIFVSAVGISLPLMVFSSIILLHKISKVFSQEYPPRLYIIIIIAVILFVLSVLPLNIFRLLMFFKVLDSKVPPVKLIFLSQYWLIFNSTINPYIYFLIGRKWNETICCSIRESLLRAFMVEDTEHFSERHEIHLHAETN